MVLEEKGDTFEGRVGNRAGSSPASDTRGFNYQGCGKKTTAFLFSGACVSGTHLDRR